MLERQGLCNTYLLRTLNKASLIASAACYRALWKEQKEFKSSHDVFFIYILFLILATRRRVQLLWTHLLPRGNKPLDFSQFLAAF